MQPADEPSQAPSILFFMVTVTWRCVTLRQLYSLFCCVLHATCDLFYRNFCAAIKIQQTIHFLLHIRQLGPHKSIELGNFANFNNKR